MLLVALLRAECSEEYCLSRPRVQYNNMYAELASE